MADVFNRTTDSFGGSFSADQATITFPAIGQSQGAESGLLVQNMNASYQQQVTRLFEVGSPNIYYVGGRTNGQASMARVVGPRKLQQAFYQGYGDVCRARTNSIRVAIAGGCDVDANNNLQTQKASTAFTAKFVVITAIGLSITAADMLINESLTMMFSSFTYE